MFRAKDSRQSIKVAIRIRPILDKQSNEEIRTCVHVEESRLLHLITGSQIKKFAFDTIFSNQNQQQIFEKFGKKCAKDCLEGYNCTIFAYGQTGAGKTYTMLGLRFEDEDYDEHRGLIPRIMDFMLDSINQQQKNGVKYTVRCSYLEIYNEQIIDLLNKPNTNLQLRQDTKKGVHVQGITEQIVTRYEQIRSILERGSKLKHVSSTIYNEASSRSHSVFILHLESKQTKNGLTKTKSRQFNFIDLAGSERTKLSTGERLKEGCNINKSLMNLSAVISALSEVSAGKMQHINYRSSKLTFLLKDSLEGNSKTNLIANIHPAANFYQETLSTLGFARRTKLVKRQKALINQDSTGSLQSLKNEIKRLNHQIATYLNSSQQVTFDKGIQEKQISSFMTSFIEDEIDKQTKFEAEIKKLNIKINQLQTGIKRYSDNQVHLRMIINVYEDKVARLKKIEETLKGKISTLDQSSQQSRLVIEYYMNERENYIKLLRNAQSQIEANKFLKTLLLNSNSLREENEESLKELIEKNTAYLEAITAKVDDIKQNNQPKQVQIPQIATIEKSNREQQLEERLDQANLEIMEYRLKIQQNEQFLQRILHEHAILEENYQLEKREKQNLKYNQQALLRQLQKMKQEFVEKGEQLQSFRIQSKLRLEQAAQQKIFLNNLIKKAQNDNAELKQLLEQLQAKRQQVISQNKDLCIKLQMKKSLVEQYSQLVSQKQLKNIEIQNLLNENVSKHKKAIEDLQIFKHMYEESENTKKKYEQSLLNVTAQLDQQTQMLSMTTVQLQKMQRQRDSIQKILFQNEKNNEQFNQLLKQNEKDLEQMTRKFDNSMTQIQNLKKINKQITLNLQSKLKQQNKNVHSINTQLQRAKQNIQASYKQEMELQMNEIQRLHSQIQKQIESKERMFDELRRQKEDNLQLKENIQIITTENSCLRIELQQKRAMYQKLADECANYQSRSQKPTSQNYLKTIQLLEKAKTQQRGLKKQNDELKKTIITLKQTIKEKKSQLVEQQYNLLSLKTKYAQIQASHTKLLKQKDNYDHFNSGNEALKDQIRHLKQKSSKIAHQNEQIQVNIKRASLDSVKLERQYEDIKNRDSIISNSNEKNSYVHRLKAEIASLKTERALLIESLNKERDQISKLRLQAKKEDNNSSLKIEFEKKIVENKNLTELIFQIVSQLRLYVSEPKTKLEVIRSIILEGIKEKQNQIKNLKTIIKDYQRNNQTNYSTNDYSSFLQSKEVKTNTILKQKRYLTEEGMNRHQKTKEANLYLKNFSSQNMREYEKFNAKLKYNQNQIQRKGFD